MKPKKKPKKAVWKGWGIKNTKTGRFVRLFSPMPILNTTKKNLNNTVSISQYNEKAVKVEVREV